MRKRILSLLLAFVMALSLAVPALAAEAPEDPVSWEQDAPAADEAAPANDMPAPASEPAEDPLTKVVQPDGGVYKVTTTEQLKNLFAAISQAKPAEEIHVSVEQALTFDSADDEATLSAGTVLLTVNNTITKSNTKGLAGTDAIYVTGGKLTIEGSGSIKGSGWLVYARKGTIDIKGATIEREQYSAGDTTENAKVNGTRSSVMVDQGGTVNIYDGATLSGYGRLAATNGGTLTINGGTLTQSDYFSTSTVTSDGENGVLNIHNGTITGSAGVAGPAKLVIDGGTFTPTSGFAVSTNGAETSSDAVVDISGGTFTSSNGVCAYFPRAKVDISGGKFNGKSGIVVRGADLTVSGSAEITATGSSTESGQVGDAKKSGSAYSTAYGAIVVDKPVTDSANSYRASTVQITGGTIKGAENSVLVYTEDGAVSKNDASKIFTNIEEGMSFDHSIANLNLPGAAEVQLSEGTGYIYYSAEKDAKDAARETVGSKVTKLDGEGINTVTAYKVTLPESSENYTVVAKVDDAAVANAFDGETVTVEVTLGDSCVLESLAYSTGAEDKDIEKNAETGAYSFTMPKNNVTIKATTVTVKSDVTTAEGENTVDGAQAADVAKAIGVSKDELKEEITVKPTVETAPEEIVTEVVTPAEIKAAKSALSVDETDDLLYHVVTSIEIKAETAIANGAEDGVYSLTLDITPKATVYATTAASLKEVQDGNITGSNAHKMGEMDLDYEKTPVKLTVPIPKEFVQGATNGMLLVKHVHGSDTYWYDGEVTDGTPATVTFTNPNGFSSFTVMSRKAAAQESSIIAIVNGTAMTDLAEAVSAVGNNGTIILLNAPLAETVITVDRPVTFTIEAESAADLAKITIKPGSGFSISQSTSNGGKTLEVRIYEPSTGGGSSPSVDKSKLNAAITAAEALKEEDYTAESWADFETALAAAKTVAAKSNPTQTEVDAALSALTTAQNVLVKKGEEQKPSPGEEIKPPAGGTGWRWVESEKTYYYFKDGKRVGDYWIGQAQGGSAWPNNWYYADTNGKLLTGFQYLDDLKGGKAWYMLQTTTANGEMGKMLTGWQWTYDAAVGTGYFSPKYGSQGACTYTTKWGTYSAATGLWGDGLAHVG